VIKRFVLALGVALALMAASMPGWALAENPNSGYRPLGALEDPPEAKQHVVPHANPKTALPASIDLSAGLPPVGDQGWEGSCVAWSIAYYYASFQEGKEHKWDLTDTSHQFSPAFVYNQINGGHDFGSSPYTAMQLMQSKGVASMWSEPYRAGDYASQPNASQLQDAKPYGVGNITVFAEDDLVGMKQHLAAGDLVSVTIPVYGNFDQAGKNPVGIPSGGWSDKSFRGNHEVTIVGYDDSKSAFRIVNSWGSAWGDKGFAWLSYDFMSARSNPEGGKGYMGYAMTSIPDTLGLVGGTVTDSNNKPVNGAKVATGSTSVTTDSSGQFTLATAPGSPLITVTANGLSTYSANVRINAGVQTLLNPAMKSPQGTLTGKVTDATTHQAISGATIYYGDNQSLTTNASGSFSITLPAGAQTIRVRAPQHDDWTQTVQVTAGLTGALSPVLKLTPTTLTGTVLDASTHQPVVGATVTVGNVSVKTDAAGKFLITPPTGLQSMSISMTGYTSWATAINLPAGYPLAIQTVNLAKTSAKH
jgi:hypothetical protein